jgi:sec-independent protein translocase protein TatA
MNTMLAVFGLGGWEVILILAVVLILFGAKKLPELAKGLGQGIREFKKASNEITSELQRAGEEDTSHRQVQYHPPEKTIEASTSGEHGHWTEKYSGPEKAASGSQPGTQPDHQKA